VHDGTKLNLQLETVSIDDVTVLRKVAEGDENAVRILYRRYSQRIYGFALKSTGNREAAEDIMIDVFAEVWRTAGRYRAGRSKPSTWIMTICRHRSIDWLRKRGVRPERNSVAWDDVAPSNEPQSSDSVASTAEREETKREVRAAVGRLPSEQAEPLNLAFFGGLSHSQIAEYLDQPVGTIKTRIRAAMIKLREWLGEDDIGQSTGRSVTKKFGEKNDETTRDR